MRLRTVILIFCILAILLEVEGKKKVHRKHKKGKKESHSKHKEKDKNEVGKSSKEKETGGEGNPNELPDKDYDTSEFTAGGILQQQFLAVLHTLANSTVTSLSKVSVAAEKLLEELADQGFGFLSSLASIPEILVLDAPTQFIESLKLLKKKLEKKNGTLNLADAFEIIIEWVERCKESSGMSQLKLADAVTFWPTILKEFHKFFKQTIRESFKAITV